MLDNTTKEFIAAHRTEDPRTLALQAKRYPNVDIREAVVQIEGWQLSREKLPTWAATEGITYPPRISMEQCSSEATATYKASLAHGSNIADLTGGFGIDCSYLARNFDKATYIERNGLLCDIARDNFDRLGMHHITVINGNSEEQLTTLPQQDWIFIDPARRDGDGRKVVALSDCEPNVVVLEEQLMEKACKVMIKCSPMLDITAACRELRHVSEIHIVAVKNECKELLFILSAETPATPSVTCVNLRGDSKELFTFTPQQEQESAAAYTDKVGTYLYEPNAAIQKAGCFHSLATATNTLKLHPNSHLFTSDEYVGEFPGRQFRVKSVHGFSKEDIKQISTLGKANITVRNFNHDTALLRKRLKLADGGENYIFATTLSNGEKVLVVCEKA